MQFYSCMQCRIVVYEKNYIVALRFSNANPLARKPLVNLREIKKTTLLTTMDVYNHDLLHLCYIEVFQWPILLNIWLALRRNGIFLKLQLNSMYFHCSSFLSSFVILIKDRRTEGIFCLKAAEAGIGQVVNQQLLIKLT